MTDQLCKEIETALHRQIKTPKDFDFLKEIRLIFWPSSWAIQVGMNINVTPISQKKHRVRLS